MKVDFKGKNFLQKYAVFMMHSLIKLSREGIELF